MDKTTAWQAAVVALVASACAACTATPLPTPPSVRAERMSLVVAPDPGFVTLSGSAGAVIAGVRLRVTDRDTAVETEVAADGSFAAPIVTGTLREVFWLEVITSDGADVPAGAVTGAAAPPGVVRAPVGPDADGDTSPDAIDCAPADPALAGRACATSCGLPELCGNGLDDDCDGVPDDGCTPGVCPAGSVDCDGDPATACIDIDADSANCGACGAACSAAMFCSGGACMAGACTGAPCDDGNPCTVDSCDPATGCVFAPAPEICGNGVDDDCNGMVDEGCAGCASGTADCNGDPADGCEVDLSSDARNCGACAAACSAGLACTSGVCG